MSFKIPVTLLAPLASKAASTPHCNLRRVSPLLCLCLFAISQARGQLQGPAEPDNVVRVSVTLQLKQYWEVRGAGLIEQLSGTNGYLALENVSGITVDQSVFYAEYFDSTDRFCFSLTFSLARNIGDRTPVAPGEKRTVYSAAAGLLPASRPNHVRIHLLRNGASEEAQQTTDIPTIRAPVTLDWSVASNATTLQLPPELASAKSPFVDLLLATVRVNDRGEVTETNILNTVSPVVQEWFLNFVRMLSFYPATNSNTPVGSVMLINVIAVLSKQGSTDFLGPASELPWVNQYAKQVVVNEVPAVTQIVFSPQSIQLTVRSEYAERPPAPTRALELVILGSEWSSPCYEWVRDESMPHHLRRKLVGSEIPQ